MKIIDLGTIQYADALSLQEETVSMVREGAEECLFLLEHYPVISFGRNGGEENLPLPVDFFETRGVTLFKTKRGGNITCHFPGQLVVYPIMRIEKQPGGLKRFFLKKAPSVPLAPLVSLPSAKKNVPVFGLVHERFAPSALPSATG